MSRLVTIFGGSGFVGRYIARRMARQGWRVRVAVRKPNDAIFVRTYGTVGQVEPVFCNIRDDASVSAVLSGADAAVNCVGTFERGGRNNFEAVHVDGAARIARLSAAAGVKTLVSISALGADEDGASQYARSKARGEAAVLAAFPTAVILRPSVIFGPEDGFFNRFAGMARMTPILPLVGAETRFQPVYVDDVAQAVEVALMRGAAAGIHELGGPEVKPLRGWIEEMLDVIHRRRIVINLPFWMGTTLATILDSLQAVTLGLYHNDTLTRDQVIQLRSDNVVSGRFPGLEAFGVEPTPAEAILPDYLWPYRPSGQYDEIKASARNLKA